MATQTYSYARGENPEPVCEWIRERGGRAIPVGVSTSGVGIVFDSGFGTAAKLALPGDQLSFNTGSKVITVAGLLTSLGLKL